MSLFRKCAAALLGKAIDEKQKFGFIPDWPHNDGCIADNTVRLEKKGEKAVDFENLKKETTKTHTSFSSFDEDLNY